MGAVAVIVIAGIARADAGIVVEIIAMIVIDIAVAVVVDAVAPNLPFVDPEIVHQIRVVDVDSCVNHADDNAGSIVSDVPSLGRVDVVHPIEDAKIRIVGDRGVGCYVIGGFGDLDRRHVDCQGRGHVDRFVQIDGVAKPQVTDDFADIDGVVQDIPELDFPIDRANGFGAKQVLGRCNRFQRDRFGKIDDQIDIVGSAGRGCGIFRLQRRGGTPFRRCRRFIG